MSPESKVVEWVVFGFAVFGGWRLLKSIRDRPPQPEPWPQELEEAIHQEDAAVVCHHCITPQPPHQRFCEHCGASIGKYNNVMPVLCYYSIGEVSLHGLCEPIRPRWFNVLGYLMLPLASGFAPLAPFYWFRFFWNMRWNPPREDFSGTESAKEP